jgi:hypothetical protein
MSDNPGTKQQTEKQRTADQLEAGKKWLQLVAQARTDKTLKQRLMEMPVVVLREHGINIRQGLDIRVVENTDKVVYLPLPAVSELSDSQLDSVVGGTTVQIQQLEPTVGGGGDAVLGTGAVGILLQSVLSTLQANNYSKQHPDPPMP